MSTSESFNFGSIQNEQIITDAYERIGIPISIVSYEKLLSAFRSMNFIMQSWLNRGLNLFTVKLGMISLNNGQTSYLLPNTPSDILEACLRTSTRNLGGTAFSSSGGIAQNAFDGNPLTSCAQTAPNGSIWYSWGSGNFAISMLGVMSYTTQDYTLTASYWNGTAWNVCLSIPRQTYSAGVINWFVIPIPTPGSRFMITESGGATLNIAELYFDTNVNDRILARTSRSEYMAYPNKSQPNTPTTFWVDRQISPVLYLYPTPNGEYNNLFYSYIQQIEDAGSMINAPAVPARFLDAITAELACRLAGKEGKFDIVQQLGAESEKAFKLASIEDTERGVNLRIFGDYRSGWVQQ